MEYIVIDSGGKKVSKEEAAEIIRRTDSFYEELLYGNNHEFNRTLYQESGIKADYKAIIDAETCCDMSYEYLPGNTYRDKTKYYDKWKKKWGCLDLHIFLNHWISCCNIDGPNGWISPEGDVGGLLWGGKYGVDEDELEKDLEKVASEWPSLNFTVYYIDCSGDKNPIWVYAEWRVKDGKVTKMREDYETKDIVYSGIDEEIYNKHLQEAEDPECWWSLDELKKLWPGKLTSGGKKAEG
jgi:hypothetical protein